MKQNKQLTNGELKEISTEIDELNARIEILDGSNPIEANELDQINYRLCVIEQVLEKSLYETRRSKLTLIQGGGQ